MSAAKGSLPLKGSEVNPSGSRTQTLQLCCVPTAALITPHTGLDGNLSDPVIKVMTFLAVTIKIHAGENTQ